MEFCNTHIRKNNTIEKRPSPASNLFSDSAIQQGRDGKTASKQYIKGAVVVFTDISGFQQLTERYGDVMCASIIESLFTQFDNVAKALGLVPLKTNGDQYILTGFCTATQSNRYTESHWVRKAVTFSITARNLVSANTLLVAAMCYLRVGIATGPILAGHSSRTFAGFDIWGGTVNLAAMLEQFTAPNTIAVCRNSFEGLQLDTSHTNCYTLNGVEAKQQRQLSTSLTFHLKVIKTKAANVTAFVC